VSKSLLTEKITIVWLVLTVLTGISWVMSDGTVPTEASATTYVAIGLFVLAFFKVRLVIMYFMEVHGAPWPLRILFEVWVLGIFLAVVRFYLQGASF